MFQTIVAYSFCVNFLDIMKSTKYYFLTKSQWGMIFRTCCMGTKMVPKIFYQGSKFYIKYEKHFFSAYQCQRFHGTLSWNVCRVSNVFKIFPIEKGYDKAHWIYLFYALCLLPTKKCHTYITSNLLSTKWSHD